MKTSTPAPCPFCGSEHPTTEERRRDRSWFVQCGYCQAKGPTAGLEEEAINYWNERKKAARKTGQPA